MHRTRHRAGVRAFTSKESVIDREFSRPWRVPSRSGKRVLTAALVGVMIAWPAAQPAEQASVRAGVPGLVLVSLAQRLNPPGFELQDVSVTKHPDEVGPSEVVVAEFLGPGTRNAVRFLKFTSEVQAKSFLEEASRDGTEFASTELPSALASSATATCSVKTLATCLVQVGDLVVSGVSASTCPHPRPEARDRAVSLLGLGMRQLQQG